MNILDVVVPMFTVKYKMKKLDAIYKTEFPGKSKNPEDLKI